ncbi:o-succinylbenzoate synthase [Schaalia sp. 19OD2882]|uniref:o-succinylbenzoate synthase n=1 Tax=Schaalia sp. 19OD2882 TaxID=2794089 RepID=UPI001C1EE3EB|nr:o-succinylbenzoate synthase [Schaalia sp. 19OD2882]QWW19871.1 o-succinylbenzoate synthase [Schaalia sp. 19OD2882]
MNDHHRPGPNACRARLAEIPLSVLPAHVRGALPGIDRMLLHHTPLTTRFRGVTHREGLLLHGGQGWAEAAPFWDYDPQESARWLTGALVAATSWIPRPKCREVPVNVTIAVCQPDVARRRVRASGGCLTAKVKVADPGRPLAEDVARVEAVAEELAALAHGRPAGLRVDVNGVWDVDQAVTALGELDRAAAPVGGLEYAEQPCWEAADLARVRARTHVPIAADESLRRAADQLAAARDLARIGAADVAVVKVAPLGGPVRALEIAAECGLDVVVSSALESSVGLACAAQVAASLPGRVRACGLATAQLMADDPACPTLAPSGGCVDIAPRTPCEELVGAAALPEGMMERWLTRLDLMSAHVGRA